MPKKTKEQTASYLIGEPAEAADSLESVKPLPPPDQDNEALERYFMVLRRLRDERTVNRKEFDGMQFEQDYARNYEANFSYLRPKKNDDDVRVNSGTAEKKIELMLNELLAMNFQPEVRAYNGDNFELVDLGADFTDIVRQTNEQEQDEGLWEEVYQDLLTQRAAFFEECLTNELPGGFVGKSDRRVRGIKRRISPLQVYPGDMAIPVRRIDDQPCLVVYDRMLYAEAKAQYGFYGNFKYVSPGMHIHTEFLPWFKYRFSTLQQDEVEVITYMSSAKFGDEYQVIINNVLMEDPGTPMKKRNGYPIKGASVKPIPDFFYGKPPIASAKFLQALQDETLRNLVRKMRQAIEPPIGVKTGKTPTRDMWEPAAVTQGVSKDNFSRLIDHDGVTSSEFSMYQLIVQKTEEFIGAISINNEEGGAKTATQVIELQKQAIKMLGLAVLAIIRLKQGATFMRIETVMDEYTKPLSQSASGGKAKKKYRQFEINDGTGRSGETVKKYVSFINSTLTDEDLEGVKSEEDRMSREEGKDVRMSFVNVDALKSVPILFRVAVTPEQRDSGSLDKVLFQDRLVQAGQIMQITGKRPNGDKIAEDYERTWKARGWFNDDAMGGGGPQGMLAELEKMQSGAKPPDGVPASNPLQASPSPLSGSKQGQQAKQGLGAAVGMPNQGLNAMVGATP